MDPIITIRLFHRRPKIVTNKDYVHAAGGAKEARYPFAYLMACSLQCEAKPGAAVVRRGALASRCRCLGCGQPKKLGADFLRTRDTSGFLRNQRLRQRSPTSCWQHPILVTLPIRWCHEGPSRNMGQKDCSLLDGVSGRRTKWIRMENLTSE